MNKSPKKEMLSSLSCIFNKLNDHSHEVRLLEINAQFNN